MFLAFSLADIIHIPFGYLLEWLYQLFNIFAYNITFKVYAVTLVFSKKYRICSRMRNY